MQQQTSPLAAPSAFLPVLVLEVFSTDWLGFDRHRLEVSPPSPPLPLPLLWLTSASCCCHSISSHPISPQGYGHLVLPVAVPVPVPVPGGGAPGNAEAEAAGGRPDGQYHCDGMPAPRSRSRTRTGRDVLVPTWRPRGHPVTLPPAPCPCPCYSPLLSLPVLSCLAFLPSVCVQAGSGPGWRSSSWRAVRACRTRRPPCSRPGPGPGRPDPLSTSSGCWPSRPDTSGSGQHIHTVHTYNMT